ncbi:MAG: GntR family transcriptional regulator [Verrucomicrobiota bacterium]
MSTFKPTTLTDQIYHELQGRILRCQLPPGERLVEKALCSELGVSRTSLREVLNRLAQDKLVTLKPNCGFSVTPITIEGFRNVCELRRLVEPQVAALAAERASEQDIAEMRRHAVVDCAFDDDDAFTIYCGSNRAFHQSIAECIDNLLLEDIVLSALDKDQQPIYYGIDLAVCTSPDDVTREHLAIVDAIAAHDAQLAAKLMAQHIGKKEDRILEALKAKGVQA